MFLRFCIVSACRKADIHGKAVFSGLPLSYTPSEEGTWD